MKKKILLASATVWALTSMASNPVEVEPDSLKSVELQNVQVVALRATKKTPMAYSDISKQQLQQLNYGQDIPFLLSLTPSVTTTSDAGTGIGYTGIHVRGTDPTRINITANGIPLNDAESSQLYWVNMSDFASSVESMQIQRGVGTSTNGAGAFGATVNMQTENISSMPFARLDLSGGSYDTHKETFRFGTGLIGDHWAVQGRLSNIGSNGYIDRASTRLNSYFLQGGYFANGTVVKFITFNGTEKTYHAWDYASKADMALYGRRYNPSGIYTDSEGNTAFYSNQTDNYHQQHYQLILNQDLGHLWKLNAALHYTKGQGYYEQYKESQKLYKYWLSEEKGNRSDLIRQKKMDNDFYGGIASFNYDDHKRLVMNFGGGLNNYEGTHFGKVVWVRTPADITLDPLKKYYDNSARKLDGNVYAKVNYEFVKGLNGFLDLQYRHVGTRMSGPSQEFNGVGDQVKFDLDKKYDFFNPKFGLSYDINRRLNVYASYAIAHKEPTRNDFEDMLAEADPVSPKAERLNDLEAGVNYRSGKFSAGANFYYMDYDNQFVLTGAQDTNGEMIARNIKDTYRLGLELTAAWQPFDGFSWNVNAAWSRNRAKNMDINVIDPATWDAEVVNIGTTHLAFSPDLILNNVFSYEWRGFRATLMSKFVDEQYMTNSNFRSYMDEDTGNRVSAMIDSYFTTDLDLSYTFHLKGVKSITVGCTFYNLFDEKYESNGSCSMNFKRADNGSIAAFHNTNDGFWSWATYSAQAPFHVMGHLSIEL